MKEDLISLEKIHLLPIYFNIVKKYKSYAGANADVSKLQEAYVYGLDVHKGQKRESGHPYFTHPLSTALYLTDYQADLDVIVAAMLHDVVEKQADYSILNQISAKFGPKVAYLVEGLTPVKGPQKYKDIENLRRLLSFARKDIRILFIKLMDRLHNLKTLNYKKNKEIQKLKAEESVKVYVPIASHFGLISLSKEFVKLSKPFLKDYQQKYKVSFYRPLAKKETSSSFTQLADMFSNKLSSNLADRFHRLLDGFENELFAAGFLY